MTNRLLLFGLLVAAVQAQAVAPRRPVPTDGVTTLYHYDDLRSSWGFTTGDYGVVEQDGELRNRNNQVALGADAERRDVLRFGAQGGERARVVDIGDPRARATQRSLYHRLTRQSVLQRLEDPAPSAAADAAPVALGHVYLVRIDDAVRGTLLAEGEPLLVALRVVDHEPGRYVSLRWRVFQNDAKPAPNGKAQLDRAKMEVIRISDAVKMFFIQNSRLPTLRELIAPDANGQAWLAGHKDVPRDPWQRAYRLVAGERPGNFEIRSDGPDGLPDTEDDISSKMARPRRGR